MQKPLYIVIEYTANIPITVELANHIIAHSFTLFIIDFFKYLVLSIVYSSLLSKLINPVIYFSISPF